MTREMTRRAVVAALLGGGVAAGLGRPKGAVTGLKNPPDVGIVNP